MKRGELTLTLLRGVAMATLLALAGCASVGPDFKPPAPPTASGYVAPGETLQHEGDNDATLWPTKVVTGKIVILGLGDAR